MCSFQQCLRFSRNILNKRTTFLTVIFSTAFSLVLLEFRSFLLYNLLVREALESVLLDGRLTLTNNLAERTVKPFVMSRRNFLFCDTSKGADASALCFSMIETAKRNGLDPFGYLLFLLQELPKLGETPAMEQLKPLFPWSESIPQYCHLT